MAHKQQNVLGNRVSRQSLIIAAIMTLVLSIIQAWLNYQELMNSVQRTFDQIRSTQAESLTTALWNYSMPEVTSITSGLINYPFISYAELRENDSVVVSAGIRKMNEVIETIIPLIYVKNNAGIHIGDLFIQADKDAILKNLARNITQILFFNALFVLILTLVFLMLIDRQITQFLIRAVEVIKTYNFSNLDSPISTTKKNTNDEIDQLIQEFNNLRLRLSKANKEQNESERKHRTLLKNLPGMAYRCHNDENWTMELVSEGCFDLTGYQPDEIINNNLISYDNLIYPDDRRYVWETVQEQIAKRLPFEMTYRIVTRNDLIRWVWERGAGVFTENQGLIAVEGFITDITERKLQERDLEAIASIGLSLRNKDTRETIFSEVVRQTTDLLDTDGCLIETIESRTGDALVQLANGTFAEFQGFRFPAGSGLNSYIRTTWKPYVNNTPSDDPMVKGFSEKKDIGPVCGVPMIAQEEPIGFLWIGQKSPISEQVVRTLSSIADIAAGAIRRVDLFNQKQQHLDRLVGLRKIDTAINNNLDLEITQDIFLSQTFDLLNVDAARLLRYDAKSQMMTFLSGRGFSTGGFMEPNIFDPLSDTGKKLLQMTSILVNDVDKDPVPRKLLQILEREGYKAVFLSPMFVNQELQGLLEVFQKKPFYPDDDWIDFFETLAGQGAIMINQAALWKNLQQSNSELRIAYDETLKGWSDALDLRDHETENHTQRVIELTLRLADMMGLSGEELINIRRGALLHDIGKMGVPDDILTKPASLTPEEWTIMRKHPLFAYNLLRPIAYLKGALDIPYCHHEKWDGSGYPRGLKKEDIPLAARIFAIADVWDAMTSDRYYRKAMSEDQAMDYIVTNSGKHFDPHIVDLFIKMRGQKAE